MSDTSKKEGLGVRRSDLNDALNQFGKNSIIESVKVINDYIKTMIPLTTGLITVYFALLEFLGVKTAIASAEIDAFQLIIPPFLMLGSLSVLIAMSFPIPKRIAIDNPTNISHYRNFLMRWRYGGAGIGTGLFLCGTFAMINLMVQIIAINE
jgi:hypothetical protein